MASASYGLVSTHPLISRLHATAASPLRGGFGNDLMLNDLGLAAAAALDVRAAIPLGELARDLYVGA